MSKDKGSGRRMISTIGADQLAAWRQAIAASKRQQRQQRGRRKRGLDAVTGPGMIRRPPPDHPASGGDAPKETP